MKDAKKEGCGCCNCGPRCGGCKFLAGVLAGLLLAGAGFGLFIAGHGAGHCCAMQVSSPPAQSTAR